ncbi:type II secretion system minor pseudopilin GspK [Ectopseudomonas hydrolytica]|jgi:general secretion pathway protein K|uniref:Type II secretion system protein K n=2 Tax=Ectopseudomonas TaxID=3236654 RepID=A4XWF8_ECTM1|nr:MULTISPECIES: type II secretion system minor pseudopilin GspK [Pseudomonas]ARS48328.1 general secretion pathway protein GspK [Pseudomonas mendocina]EJO93573.1 general secretion pathway protein K [Pseudomonas mendocina DLHK]ATH82924.1 general secretion pathway protein GspK [Pseudomonas mendocina]USR41370.1 type II secretion system minor pseudopilin GspK [Pseudomonas hydrolytica]UTH38119.1 type II secretion system minor pseudopilin GspK [Pseudomonas sp. KHPS1]
MTRQRGVALITVLLVVAVVTVVCAGLIARQQLSIRSSANHLHVSQAWQYALGGETLAKAILQRDLRQGDPRQPVDHLGELWARPLPPFPLDEGGELRVRIVDPSGRFNLNSLVRQGQPNELALLRLRRLMLRLGIEKPYAERLVDWLDSNNEPQGSNGAEDNQYLLATPPYRSANRELADVSELRLLLDMDELDYRRLLPYVSALPGDVLLNVNTAGAMVLSSLADSLTPDVALSLIAVRGSEGFPSPAAFAAQPALAGLGEQAVQGLAVGSQFFEVFSEVSLGERRVVLRSLLQRSNDGRVSILARDLGQSGAPPVPVEEQQQ